MPTTEVTISGGTFSYWRVFVDLCPWSDALPDSRMAHILLRMRLCLAFATMMFVLMACAPPVSEGGFNAPDPASKIYAIEDAVRQNDRSELPYIVEQLDSDDPAVRLVAITALQRMTGKTYGYHHYAPRREREESVRRWAVECKRLATEQDAATSETTPEDTEPHGG